VGLFLCADGYPEGGRRGDIIRGIDAARASGALVFGAGVARAPRGDFVTAAGRVLTVVGRGATVAAAAEDAYAAAAQVDYAGKQLRRDIGRTALAATVAA
jgi:phosphoribosylamine--glycine ligase